MEQLLLRHLWDEISLEVQRQRTGMQALVFQCTLVPTHIIEWLVSLSVYSLVDEMKKQKS